MKRFLGIFLIISLFSIEGLAQHMSSKYSQYLVNGLAINPAYAGSRETFTNILLYRNQWMGWEGAPVTTILSSHAPLVNEKIALGLMVSRDQIGVSDNYEIYTNYAYRFRILGGKMSLGLKAGVTINQNLFSQLETIQDDEAFSKGEDESVVLPNFGVGVYYYNDYFFAGASVPSLLSYKESISSGSYIMQFDPNAFDILATAGGLLSFADAFKLKPTALIAYGMNNTLYWDVNANAILYEHLWVGGSYRSSNEWVMMLGFQLYDQIMLGLSYDFITGDLKANNGDIANGTLEVMLRYEFTYKLHVTYPRYF